MLQKEIQLILILFFITKGFNLLLGSASKSNFWQYFKRVIKENLIDFEIVFFEKKYY